ncbi:succinylglutamate desuccinylase/aspartoacylase family protein [Marivirga sp. S37H4]|uniref:Succinylglutamate desuccinylase/aspartoacylase family protein n=1 Tax=Marivirga aurantiaca TaxID=2802615 RepID=A0A935C5I0_9BACT|nr:succinylglutamate desuccinylase/aspartoacylase family protein [Marivirga aurantiaca]MBK6263815.1 succinylglutamate desuccinylase/aspartoacylase family protein [Marivirga aurantiaca]
MVKITHKRLKETTDVERVIGSYSKNKPGPTLIFLCGTHGNETSSVFGIKKVFETMERFDLDVDGEMVAAFAGNLEALSRGVRFIDNDMNRGWVTARLRKLGFLDEKDEMQGHERKEQQEIIKLLKEVIGRAKGEIFIFDLHTTSSVSPPFCAISDTIRNRKVALQFPVPCVVGFDEQTRGTFMNYISEMGLPGVAFEAGEHYALDSIENNIAFIWCALTVVGCMKPENIPQYDRHFQFLGKANFGEHKIFDLVYHHEISPEDKFQMKSGYTTFDKIEKGEHLADDIHGPVYAQESGHIFMPLYQAQGDDGYFIVQEKSKEWLELTEKMRSKRDDKYLKELPGAKVHPEDKHTLIIEQKLYDDIRDRLHMLGFRRKRSEDGKIIITRRAYDIDVPDLESLKMDL